MLRPEQEWEIPELTKQIAGAAFPKGNLLMKIRDELGPFFAEHSFAELYPTLGQPALSPARLALVTTLQYLENLSDRQAAEAVRSRIDWKYLLGLELSGGGFDYSVLSEFRTRLLEGQAESVLFESLLAPFSARGLLNARGQQRSDSTHILAAVRHLNRIKMVGESLRHALNTLAVVESD